LSYRLKTAKGGAAVDPEPPNRPQQTRKDGAARRSVKGEISTARARFDFSYSGIKTAVLRYVETHEMTPSIEARRRALAETPKPKLEDYRANCDQQTLDLVASFQRAMVEDLVQKSLAAAREYDVATLFVTGGVAANNELRETFEREAAEQGLPVFFPSRPLSTDNAAMIAAAAYPKWLAQQFAPIDVSAEAGMALR
jgi:N6-L-threonylcarbamoyladenine synthase